MAVDSEMAKPSSSTRTGVLPIGFSARKIRLLLLGGDEVDRDELDQMLKALLGQHDSDACGVGCAFAVVKFHVALPIYR